jgi:hypothetical protein
MIDLELQLGLYLDKLEGFDKAAADRTLIRLADGEGFRTMRLAHIRIKGEEDDRVQSKETRRIYRVSA